LVDSYSCLINTDPNILTEESAQISNVSRTHDSKTNDDVLNFHAQDKTIQFFPKDLSKFFKNLKKITMVKCQLKEIHQSDLKDFPNLIYIDMFGNKIEVIEEGLFDYNANLEVISISNNKLIHIDPNVFDHLNKLRYFIFSFVPCVGLKNIYYSKDEIHEALKSVKPRCSNSEYLDFDNQIENLEVESKILKSEDFNKKIVKFEKSFNNSKFSKFRPLNYKFQNLKLTFGSSDSVKLNKSSSVNANNQGRSQNFFEWGIFKFLG